MKTHQLIGTILVIVGAVYGLGLVWLYFSLQPQFNAFAEFERKHVIGKSSNFFSSQPESPLVQSADPIERVINKGSFTGDLSSIVIDASRNWRNRNWLSRRFLSIVGYLASAGGTPSDFAKPQAMLWGVGQVLLLLLVGSQVIANSKRKSKVT